MTGNTGVRLQYTHCRLKSLQEKSSMISAAVCDPLLLSEPAAVNLVFEISRLVKLFKKKKIFFPILQFLKFCRFEEVLERSFNELEASKLSEYLFTLW